MAAITLRLLDLFRIGLGPSSSHTVGPMRAAARFRGTCLEQKIVPERVTVDLKGSLSATGRGHATDQAVLAGLHGWDPETCDLDAVHALPTTLARNPRIPWGDGQTKLRPEDIRFLPYHPGEALPHANTMVCKAEQGQTVVFEQVWCSVGGGFVRLADSPDSDFSATPARPPRLPFRDTQTLLAHADEMGGTLGDVVLENETGWEDEPGEVAAGLDKVWDAFRACISRGLDRRGELPGGLGVKRRAGDLLDRVETGVVGPAYRHIARAQA
ncbi:MAG: serine dehydratase beta chain, partial [Planctomycetota bacterium]